MNSVAEKKDHLPSILILHFHSSANAGDAAQLFSAIQDLQDNFRPARIVVSANYPEEEYLQSLPIEVIPSISNSIGLGSETSKAKLILRLFLATIRLLWACLFPGKQAAGRHHPERWRKVFLAYKRADLVCSTPGNIFFTRGRIGFLSSALAVLPAICLKKPFYILPQSIGPLKRRWERLMVKRFCSSARIVFVREPSSYREVIDLGVPREKVVLTHDQSLTYPKTRTQSPPQPLLDAGFTDRKPSVGVSVIPNFVNLLQPLVLEKYYEVLAKSLANFLGAHGAYVYFFPQVTGPSEREDDRLAAKKVIHMLTSHKESVKLIKETLTPEELKACYQWMDIFIASRLHSAIFSMTCAVPTLMISYLDKTKGAAELFDWQDFTIEITKLTVDNLSDKLSLLWEQRSSLSPLIENRLSEILETYPKPGALIFEDYYSE